MEFTFSYNKAERKTIDQLHNSFVFGPLRFAWIVVICFVPTLAGLCLMQMWTSLLIACLLIAMAALLPLLAKRNSPSRPEEPSRAIKFTPVGIRAKCGASVSFLKWMTIEEAFEDETGFLFARHQRYFLLPKRSMETSQIQEVRDFIAVSRNHPASANEPLTMYSQLFEPENAQQTWRFDLGQSDLTKAIKSQFLPVHSNSFNHNFVETNLGKPKTWPLVALLGFFCTSLLLIAISLPIQGTNLKTMIGVMLVAVPFLLIFGAARWIRWRAGQKMPYLREQSYSIRLFTGGWAVGNEDLVSFHGWNENTTFYLSRFFIGIRSDHGLMNILPNRAFADKTTSTGVYNFLARSVGLRTDWLIRKHESENRLPIDAVPPIVDEHSADSNPYQTPKS